MVHMDLIEDTVVEVEWCLSGGTGTGRTDSVSLQRWLLHFGEAVSDLRLIVADFSDWLANECPSWAAYCVLMSGRLITLDKHPGI